eukprot:COSAG06_NODE_7334_length_2542_cov_1.848138_1_plen_230_part_10
MQRGLQGTQQCPKGCTHYIIIEGVSELNGRLQVEEGPSLEFQLQLVQRLSKTLPSISFASLNGGCARGFSEYADYLARDLPLVLLDSRTISDPNETMQEAQDSLLELEESLFAAGTVNHYEISMLARLMQVIKSDEANRAIKRKPDTKGEAAPGPTGHCGQYIGEAIATHPDVSELSTSVLSKSDGEERRRESMAEQAGNCVQNLYCLRRRVCATWTLKLVVQAQDSLKA